MPHNNRRRSRGAGVLKFGTHNICGLNPLSNLRKLGQALDVWSNLQLDVVFIQEHHVKTFRYSAELHMEKRGWTSFWGFNHVGADGGGRGSAGVLIAVRSRLLWSGALVLKNEKIWGPATAADRRHDPNRNDGRCLSIDADWAGHKLQLACIYMPNSAPDRKKFIQDRLQPLLQAAGSRVPVWGGDFNFVHNPSLDRLTRSAGALLRPTATSDTTGKMWETKLPGLTDVWRKQHHSGRMMTWFARGNGGAARLDRFYVGDSTLSYATAPCRLRQARYGAGGALSDHCPVVMQLAAKVVEGGTNQRVSRLRLFFFQDADLTAELAAWLDTWVAAIPTAMELRVKWWRRLQKKLRWKVRQLNAAHRQRMHAPVATLGEIVVDLQAAIEGDCLDAAEEALEKLPAAREELTEAQAAQEERQQTKSRREWIEGGERASRALTGQINPVKHQGVTALKAANGDVVSSGPACATVITACWAEVCKEITMRASSQSQVLGAVDRRGTKLDPDRAEALGSADVTADEVKQALRKCKPGKAPGADGIPVELYKKFKAQFAPILAAVFTAIGRRRQVPAGFLDSIITVIYKKGERLHPLNYRPISLTNTDYRILARVLAGRLGEVLPAVIDPAQTAFIKGRSIGENVLLLQLLPALLQEEKRSGIVAFCDFRKAYDTVDRNFLLAVAEKLGLGEGFLQWIRLLLRNTRSAAVVNGYVAEPRLFVAGVRQGCPLAPLLYLLVAQAALLWLRDQGIGMEIEGELMSGMQYADDLKALLAGPEQVPAFKAAMKTFEEASGQALEPTKTKLLFIGTPPEGALPEEIEGMKVVHSAKALGLTYSEFSGDVEADWDELRKESYRRLQKIVRCKLTAFGRAFAVNSYALSTFLYHAEFAGLQEDAELTAKVAAVVDRDFFKAPTSAGASSAASAPQPRPPRFAGIAQANQIGRPRDGGLGVLAVKEHIAARHAKWGLQLAVGDARRPWVRAGRALMRRVMRRGDCPPGIEPQLLLLAPPAKGWEEYLLSSAPKVLHRLVNGILALPRLEVLHPWEPGPWCAVMPLWANPLLRSTSGGLETTEAGRIFKFLGQATLGDVLSMRDRLRGLSSSAYGQQGLSLFSTTGYYLIPEHWQALEAFDHLLAALPAAMVSAAEAALAGDPALLPSRQEVVNEIISRVGWHLSEQLTVTPATLKVKQATRMQVRQHPSPQQPYLEAFAAHIGEDVTASSVRSMLRRLWALPWDNRHKETMWRLVLNGLPTAARRHKPAELCSCGGVQCPDRAHSYDVCPTVRPIWASIQAQLTAGWALPTGTDLRRRHLWLAERPVSSLHQGVWDVVSLAAVQAMDAVRARCYARLQTGSTPGPALVAWAGSVGVAKFWTLLGDFCGLHLMPASWRDGVPSEHPFIRFSIADGRWHVHRL